jgi:type I restriction enzyme R subunit
MRGRGTRKAKGKPLFTMFDFVGVSEFHGDDDGPIQGTFIAEPKPKKQYTPRRLLTVDVDDHIDPTSRAWVTTDEDGRLVFPEISEARANELGAAFEAWLLCRPAATAEQGRWLALLGNQIRANADTWTEVSAGSFAFQPFSSMGGLGEALRVWGGLDALEATLASLNAAVFKAGTRTERPSDTSDYRGDATLP